jgi:glycogen debranching enzyme
MRHFYIGLILYFFLALISCVNAGPPELDKYDIELAPGEPHKFVFTNKFAAFWFGEIQQENLPSHQGYTILEQRYLKDYALIRSGEPLAREQAKAITLYPDRLERRYADFTETLYFLDSLNAILVRVEASDPVDITFEPRFDDLLEPAGWRWLDDHRAAVCRVSNLPQDKPAYITMSAWGDTREVIPLMENGGKSAKKHGENIPIRGLEVKALRDAYFTVMFDFQETRLLETLEKLRNKTGSYISKRSQRLHKLLQNAQLSLPDSTINRAYPLALFSMDDLITRQRGDGIWAGLPWFNNYWGRDSFISLPGALLCTGQFEQAKQVLLSFSEFQDQDEKSSTFGRIPNRVMLNEIIYNTTDGTPWFVLACEKYVRYSGDTAFVRQIFPVIQKAMEGAIRNYVDEYGFLAHKDADTWMDAVGTEGPWSPRGNRAVEIQVLWHEQTRVSIEWAQLLGYRELAEDWRLLKDRLQMNFHYYFWDAANNRLADHINTDNRPDLQIRPNTAFAISVPVDDPHETPLLKPAQKEIILQELAAHLIYPWGVASLSQDDPGFHPYHHYSPYYVPDAAYHNGIVWTWVNGPVISALSPFNPQMGIRLLQEASRQILEEDGVGSYSELLEAWPRKETDQIKISGTVSQAWNLAEYIRNWHEDMLGIRPVLSRREIIFSPLLPPDYFPVNFSLRIGNDVLSGDYSQNGKNLNFHLDGKHSLPDLTFRAKIPFLEHWIKFDYPWTGKAPLLIQVYQDRDSLKVNVNHKSLPDVKIESRQLLPELTFVEPKMDFTINSLRGPEYDLISPEEATAVHPTLAQIVFDREDPSKDDTGPNGRYTSQLQRRNIRRSPGAYLER